MASGTGVIERSANDGGWENFDFDAAAPLSTATRLLGVSGFRSR